MAVISMTGFARVDGADEGASWFWEVRSVNGRGLDVRLRLPPGSEQIELPARERIGKRLTRGNVSVQLNQRRTITSSTIIVNEAALAQIVDVARDLQDRLDIAPPSVDGLLGLRGVLDTVEVEDSEEVVGARRNQQLADLERALDGLVEARSGEGARLESMLTAYLTKISQLVEEVAASPARLPAAIQARLREQIRRLVDERGPSLDEARLHQEAVLLATKADVEEELQRLRSHVIAARELLAENQAIGRRLDFLTQEFNREANTLCSKSNDADVTRLGLELKSTIEQMREQVQNIE